MSIKTPKSQIGSATRSESGGGRQARTRGVSLHPEEQALIERFEELTGLGFTDQVRQLMLAKLPAAVWALEEMAKAGMEPGRLPPGDEVVYGESARERRDRYADGYEPVDLAAEAKVPAAKR